MSLVNIRRLVAPRAHRIARASVFTQTRTISWSAFEHPDGKLYTTPYRAGALLEGVDVEPVAAKIPDAANKHTLLPLVSGTTTTRIPSQIQDISTHGNSQSYPTTPPQKSSRCNTCLPTLRLDIPGSPASFGVYPAAGCAGFTPVTNRPCAALQVCQACQQFDRARLQEMREAENWMEAAEAQSAAVMGSVPISRPDSETEKVTKDYYDGLRDNSAI